MDQRSEEGEEGRLRLRIKKGPLCDDIRVPKEFQLAVSLDTLVTVRRNTTNS